jgi:hypothetical protein
MSKLFKFHAPEDKKILIVWLLVKMEKFIHGVLATKENWATRLLGHIKTLLMRFSPGRWKQLNKRSLKFLREVFIRT